MVRFHVAQSHDFPLEEEGREAAVECTALTFSVMTVKSRFSVTCKCTSSLKQV